MKILITGAAGQLGLALVRRLSARHELVVATIADLDICDAAAVNAVVASAAPDAIVNCAAYTDVDGAEDQAVRALSVNAVAVRSLAAAARRAGAALVHYSTDFVFDGLATSPYLETDTPNPRSTYACSKLIGEWFAQEAERHYVLRVESLFGEPGAVPGGRRTSIDRIVDQVVAGDEARVFSDRVVSPSYMADVAWATEALLAGRCPAGLYHCVNSGQCTFVDLALEVGRLSGREPRLRTVAMADIALRAERPRYCALSSERLGSLGIAMPHWRDALGRYLAARGAAARMRE